MKEEMKRIAKKEDIGQFIKDSLQRGESKVVFEEFIEPVPIKRLQLLWEILMEADLNEFGNLEEKIYAYGSCLGTKDKLGRLFFTRMVILLRKAQSAE